VRLTDAAWVVVNGMAYSLARRRHLLAPSATVARSAREIFLDNCRAQ